MSVQWTKLEGVNECLIDKAQTTSTSNRGTLNALVAIGEPGTELVYGTLNGSASPISFVGSFTVDAPVLVQFISAEEVVPGGISLVTLRVTVNGAIPGGAYTLSCLNLPAGFTCPGVPPTVTLPIGTGTRSATAIVPVAVATNVLAGLLGQNYQFSVRLPTPPASNPPPVRRSRSPSGLRRRLFNSPPPLRPRSPPEFPAPIPSPSPG